MQLAPSAAAYAAPARAHQRASRQLKPLVPLRAMQPAKPVSASSPRQAARVTCQAAGPQSITHAVSPISDTSAWAELQQHAKAPMPHLRQLLNDEKRCESMFSTFDGITLDYSRQVRLRRQPDEEGVHGQGGASLGPCRTACVWNAYGLAHPRAQRRANDTRGAPHLTTTSILSSQRVTPETMRLLTKLADEAKLKDKIADMFAGKHINVTEDRAVSSPPRNPEQRAGHHPRRAR